MQPTPDPLKQTPELSSHRPQADPVPKPKPKPWLVGAVAALVLGSGAFFFGLGPFAPQQTDDLSQKQVQQITAEFSRAVADFPLVNLSDPKERAQAKAALNLPEAEAEQILQSAEQGQFRLSWITVWDNYAEDGDVIALSSHGYSATIGLLNSPVTVVLPVTGGGSIQITGVRDGGGGITAAARTLAGEIPFPPLAPGQTVTLPLK